MSTDLQTMMASQYYGFYEPSRTIQIPGCPHEHEVRVWLPPTYHLKDRTYPTLWVTDGFLEHATTALLCSQWNIAPEVIVVSIGQPRDSVSNMDFVARRGWDFFADPKWLQPGFIESVKASGMPSGGADIFRDYLIDELRPTLAKEYRMDPDDNCLFGHSGGCAFTTYTLFTRPEGFNKYLCTSGFLANYQALAEANFANREDLAARVYFAVGGKEVTLLKGALFPGMNSMIEELNKPKFPSLELNWTVYTGLDHFTIIPVMMQDGVRWLWRENVLGDEWMTMMSGE